MNPIRIKQIIHAYTKISRLFSRFRFIQNLRSVLNYAISIISIPLGMKHSLFNSEVWNVIFAALNLCCYEDVVEIIPCGLYDQLAPSLVEQSQGMEKQAPSINTAHYCSFLLVATTPHLHNG